jgi:hypothetical protein
MDRAALPFLLVATPAARAALGRDLNKVAVLAAQALLRHRKTLEIAHQQLRYRKQLIAFSSRVGRHGDLILELDVGDPALENRVVLEADLRRAELNARERERPEKTRWR